MTMDKSVTQNKLIAAVDGAAELEAEERGPPVVGEYALGGSAIEPGGDEEVAVTLMASFWPKKQWCGYVLVKK